MKNYESLYLSGLFCLIPLACFLTSMGSIRDPKDNFNPTAEGPNNIRAVVIQIKRDNINPDSLFEEKIFDTLMKVKKVIAKNKFIDSISHHTRGIAMIVMGRPKPGSDYYWVQLGYNGPLRFEPYFNFYVYKKGFKIKYLDTMTDKLVDLKNMK